MLWFQGQEVDDGQRGWTRGRAGGGLGRGGGVQVSRRPQGPWPGPAVSQLRLTAPASRPVSASLLPFSHVLNQPKLPRTHTVPTHPTRHWRSGLVRPHLPPPCSSDPSPDGSAGPPLPRGWVGDPLLDHSAWSRAHTRAARLRCLLSCSPRSPCRAGSFRRAATATGVPLFSRCLLNA